MLRLRVESARRAAEDIRALRLVSADGAALPPFTAGAHLSVHGQRVDGTPAVRAYSLVGDAACTDHYEIGVLREGHGGVSDWLHTLQAGDTVDAESPRNDFPLVPHAAEHLLLAGGIGITPLLSMAATLARQGAPFRLIVLARSRQRLAFADRLAALPAAEVHLGGEGSRVDLDALFRTLGRGTHAYLCGPERLLAAALAAARAAGFPPGQVHTERFGSPRSGQDRPFEVELAASRMTFTVAPGQTILGRALEAGLFPGHDCRRGECGTCLTRVVAGKPDHRDAVQTDAERASDMFMTICCSRAKSERLVLDL